MCSGAATSYGGLLACRAILGLFEAAFGPGAVYYCSLFYTRKELGTRLSIVLGTAPLANCFASALAYGITHVRSSIASWRLLFIVGELSDSQYTPGLTALLMALLYRGSASHPGNPDHLFPSA